MDLKLSGDTFTITLGGWEQLWAAHLGKTIYIPLKHIVQVDTGKPEGIWEGIRAPGTFVPGVIRAGTYYTQRGREFWYVTRQTDQWDDVTVLRLHLSPDEYYKRIVLAVPDGHAWGDRLQTALSVQNNNSNNGYT
ncbi:MAG: hypothetical protein AB4042_10565 [Leptolyngbyaceae cyanobacterium]